MPFDCSSSCSLLFYYFCYDTDTTELLMFGGFGWVRLGLCEYGKIQLRYAKVYWEIRHESVRIHRSVYDSSTNHVRIKGNSWQFLTIREIFSLKLGINCHLPLLEHYFQNKCCCCIGSTFGVPIPTVDKTKKTASKKLWRGDPDFLLFGWKKLLVKVYLIITNQWIISH